MQKIRINAEQKKSHMLVLNNNTHSTALKTAHDQTGKQKYHDKKKEKDKIKIEFLHSLP